MMTNINELLDTLEAIAAYHERMQLMPGSYRPFHFMARQEIERASYTLIKLRALIDN